MFKAPKPENVPAFAGRFPLFVGIREGGPSFESRRTERRMTPDAKK
jgi:hypothetical protein